MTKDELLQELIGKKQYFKIRIKSVGVGLVVQNGPDINIFELNQDNWGDFVFELKGSSKTISVYERDKLIGVLDFGYMSDFIFIEKTDLIFQDEIKLNVPIPNSFKCTCDSRDMANFGCKCGAFKAEMEYKAKLKKDNENKRLYS